MTAFGCACGFSTKSAAAEAKHRHNFPALCRRRRVPSDALYVYDCDRGQGAVRAKTLRSAVAKAAAEAGSADPPRCVRRATEDELVFRRVMEGTT